MIEAHVRLIGMIAHGDPLADVLDAALRFCESRFPDMLCSILLLEENNTMRHVAAPSLPEAYLKAINGSPIGPKAGSCGTAALLGKPVIVEDIMIDPLWAEYRSAAAPHGLRACWSTPIFDAAGKVLGTFAIYYRRPGLPTADHMKLIELLTNLACIAITACRAEREKHHVYERISDAFVALDTEWRFTYVNAKAGHVLGRKPSELIGKHVWTEFPQGPEGKFRQAFERAMADQVFVRVEDYYEPLGKWFETRAYPSQDGLTIYFHDVTDQRLQEERLRKAEKLTAIGHLAGGVAHDFNNQLAVILGYAGLLENRLADPEAKRFASAILRAANRSGDLTRNLLAFSRQGHYENVPVDLHDLIPEVCGLLELDLEKRIEVVQELRAPRPMVMGDPATLQNALLNLALNARDAMPNGGRLLFATARLDGLSQGTPVWLRDFGELAAGEWMHVEVRDTGTGMSEEAKRHVFEPFFTTKPVGKGTGLGLASVFGTVRTHGGRIAMESSPGQGTAFHLALPVAAAAASEPHPAPCLPAQRSLRVLVVDDDAPVREIMKDMLRASGHKVLEAGGGREAVEIFRESKDGIDLVILDLMMAEMDGSATYAELNGLRPGVPVLLSTGYPGDAKIPALMEAGVKGLLQKPYEKSLLDRAIAAALG